MLGVSGLRGITGQSLTPDIAARFAAAFGAWLADRAGPEPLVCMARDGRAGGEEIAHAAIRGLTHAGCRTLYLDIAMTPTLGTAIDRAGAGGGIAITASHNPQKWNGLKCLVRSPLAASEPDACAPPAADAQAIIARFHATPPIPPPDAAPAIDRCEDAPEAHAARVRRALWGERRPILPRTHILLDHVNGSGFRGGLALLDRELGLEVTTDEPDLSGIFPHPPEPTRENLRQLAQAVRLNRADIGFAQDPDADRLAIIDEQGRYIGEEYTLALAAESLLSLPLAAGRGGGAGVPPAADCASDRPLLITNLSTSRMLDDIAARHGATVLRTPVGEANVAEAMKRQRAAGRTVLLGGEGNGGVIWPSVTYVRDSLSAMALILALLARTGKKVSQLAAALPAYAIEKRKVDLAKKEDAQPAIARLAAAYKQHRLDLQDGIRIDLAHGPLAGKAWFHVRASNTEPIMRLIAEAPTRDAASRILDEAAQTALP
jgi:phosphomannomutase